MTWPPAVIAADKAPGAPISSTEHPDHHNALATAINDTVGHITGAGIAVPSELDATGTPSSSTFLRGDGSWAAADSTIVQATAPSSPTVGQRWVDNDTYIEYIWDGTVWVELGVTFVPQILMVPMATTAVTLTNATQAERFAANSSRTYNKMVPLNGQTQVRMQGHVSTASASPNTPECRLAYKTGTHSTTFGDYSPIGVSTVAISLAAVAEVDSGWINLAAGATGDIHVTLTEIGGDGVADPVIASLNVWFR